MALTTTQIITVRSAVVAAKSDLTTMIEYAQEQLSETCWGDAYANAVALLTLHLYEVNDRGGSGGSITSEREGQLARSFGATASASSWGDTSWGRELQTLARGRNFGPRTRMMPGCPSNS